MFALAADKVTYTPSNFWRNKIQNEVVQLLRLFYTEAIVSFFGEGVKKEVSFLPYKGNHWKKEGRTIEIIRFSSFTSPF